MGFLFTLLKAVGIVLAYVGVGVVIIAAIIFVIWLVCYGLEAIGILASNPIMRLYKNIKNLRRRRPSVGVDLNDYFTANMTETEARELANIWHNSKFERDLRDTGRK